MRSRPRYRQGRADRDSGAQRQHCNRIRISWRAVVNGAPAAGDNFITQFHESCTRGRNGGVEHDFSVAPTSAIISLVRAQVFIAVFFSTPSSLAVLAGTFPFDSPPNSQQF